MKELYYNPIEMPVSITFFKKNGETKEVSENIDVSELESIQSLFRKVDDYKDIVVHLTSHNEAYYPRRKEDTRCGRNDVYERVPVKGEISLKEYTDGGGYLEDTHFYY